MLNGLKHLDIHFSGLLDMQVYLSYRDSVLGLRELRLEEARVWVGYDTDLSDDIIKEQKREQASRLERILMKEEPHEFEDVDVGDRTGWGRSLSRAPIR